MRIWRDLPSSRGIGRLLAPLAAPAAASAGADTLMRLVSRARDQLEQYHGIKKDCRVQLPARLNALRNLAALIEGELNTPVGPHARHTLSGQANTVADLLRGLARRARAKADYLALLMDYYDRNPNEVRDPEDIITRMRQAQTRSADGRQLGVVPGVRLEAWDPIHRGWELGFMDDGDGGVAINPMGKTHQSFAAQWLREVRAGRCNEPLLVYLEATEHCLDGEMAKQAHTVPYMDARQGNAPVFLLRLQGGQVEQRKADDAAGTWAPFDTRWVTKDDSAKGGAIHALAYNWTTSKELFADLHNPERGRDWDTFHHSSFTGGDIIRCAGMISGVNGKIDYIDNDSGHYQPGTEHLHRLVRHLSKRNAFAPDGHVRDLALVGFPAREPEGILASTYVGNPRGAGRVVRGRGMAVAGSAAAAAAGVPPRFQGMGGHRRGSSG